jgi:hypothetical protein
MATHCTTTIHPSDANTSWGCVQAHHSKAGWWRISITAYMFRWAPGVPRCYFLLLFFTHFLMLYVKEIKTQCCPHPIHPTCALCALCALLIISLPPSHANASWGQFFCLCMPPPRLVCTLGAPPTPNQLVRTTSHHKHPRSRYGRPSHSKLARSCLQVPHTPISPILTCTHRLPPKTPLFAPVRTLFIVKYPLFRSTHSPSLSLSSFLINFIIYFSSVCTT